MEYVRPDACKVVRRVPAKHGSYECDFPIVLLIWKHDMKVRELMSFFSGGVLPEIFPNMPPNYPFEPDPENGFTLACTIY